MFDIVLIIKLIDDLRKIISEIEDNKYVMDDLSKIRVSKALGVASKVAKTALKREELKISKAEAISDKALAKVARAALLSLKVKVKSVKPDCDNSI